MGHEIEATSGFIVGFAIMTVLDNIFGQRAISRAKKNMFSQ
jgi:hypothetical protein